LKESTIDPVFGEINVLFNMSTVENRYMLKAFSLVLVCKLSMSYPDQSASVKKEYEVFSLTEDAL